MLINNFQSYQSDHLVILDESVVDDVAPEVGEHEGAGDQQVEHRDLDFADCEGEAEDVKAERDMNDEQLS